MDKINYEELVKTASEAYAILKQTGLSQILMEGVKKFTNWFGNLFSRKLHKEKVALMEQLLANEEALKILQLELEAQVEENDGLKKDINQHLDEYRKVRNNPEYESIINIANSTLKNVVNAPISVVTGNVNIGDIYNK